jgi:hypothetical protein
MNPCFHRTDGAIQDFRDLGVTQLLLVKQQERPAVFLPQSIQCPVDFLAQLAFPVAPRGAVGKV